MMVDSKYKFVWHGVCVYKKEKQEVEYTLVFCFFYLYLLSQHGIQFA